MNRLIVTLLVAGATLFGTQAYAQIMAEGGLLSYNINRLHQDADPWYEPTSGIYAGASYNYDLPFLDGLSVVPGAYLYITSKKKMSDFSFYPLLFDTEAKHKESGLLIPVMASYRYSFTSSSALFVQLGPSFQLGFSSSTKSDPSGDTVNHFKHGDFKRCDLLLGGNVGAVFFDKYIVKLSYQRGLLNAAGSNYNNTGYRYNRVFLGLGGGYIF